MAAEQKLEPGRVRFELEETPTMPGRTRSGEHINFRVVRAMQRQYAAVREANSALDDLIKALRDWAQAGNVHPAGSAGRYSFHK